MSFKGGNKHINSCRSLAASGVPGGHQEWSEGTGVSAQWVRALAAPAAPRQLTAVYDSVSSSPLASLGNRHTGGAQIHMHSGKTPAHMK